MCSKAPSSFAPPFSPAPRQARDAVVDLWRGLALVDMAWVHLVHNFIVLPGPLAPIIRDHTRFAAGAFVFLAGLSVASAFGDALLRGGPHARAARGRLLRRALLLLAVDRLLGIGVALLNQWRVFLPGGEDPLAPLVPLLVFREPGVTGGLLILYAALLGMTPVLFMLARRTGWGTIGVVSLVIYGIATASGDALHWPAWAFPVAFWQPLFVGGILACPLWRWVRNGAPRRVVGWTGMASTLFIALILVRNGALGLEIPESAFAKVPLRPGELLRYLVATHLFFSWTALAFAHSAWIRGGLGWLCRIGRNSLLVYAAHLFVEIPIVEFAWSAKPPAWIGLVLLAIDAIVLVAIARVAEYVERRGRPERKIGAGASVAWPLRIPRAGIVGVAVVIASLLSLRTVQLTLAGHVPEVEHAVVDEDVSGEGLLGPTAAPEPIAPSEPDESDDSAGA